MKLHDSVWAPSPRRVRIFLAEKGIEIERRPVDLRTGEHLTADYLAINPSGAVPALELDDGEVLTESAAICRYFEALQPDPPLFGAAPIEVARIESWTRRIETEGYGGGVYVFRNSSPALQDRAVVGNRPPIAQIPELATRGRILWDCCMEALDRQLGHSRWIAGDRYSFADITALVTIDFAARAAKLAVPEGAAHIRRWHDAASARASASV